MSSFSGRRVWTLRARGQIWTFVRPRDCRGRGCGAGRILGAVDGEPQQPAGEEPPRASDLTRQGGRPEGGPPSVSRPLFDEIRDHEGFRARRARLGRQAGSGRLGLSLWELADGEAAYPYHYHLTEEELVVVLDGRPTLRTPQGLRELGEGEVVSFPRGDGGAHQLLNRSGATVRFLAFSTNGDPDVVVYPDSGKVGSFERRPRGGGHEMLHRIADAVDYYDGERPPPPAAPSQPGS